MVLPSKVSRLDSALARWDNPRPLGSPLCAQGDAEAAADLGAPSCEAKSWATTAQVASNKVVALSEPLRLGLVTWLMASSPPQPRQPPPHLPCLVDP